jgi:RNA polymerase sigma factor (sigma-70 family)
MMAEVDQDWADLQAYARSRDEAALARVIQRHASVVYASCLRQVRDPALAADAAQAVFIVLAKKAGTVRPHTLASWLFNAGRYASRNALRAERRRRKHEKEAAMRADAVVTPNDRNAVDWRLDEAIARLPGKDRQAILLRFFHDQTHEQIGRALGTTTHAASTRLRRALDKLRRYLRGGGIDVMPAALEASLLAAAAQHAPPEFIDGAIRAAIGASATAASVAIAAHTLTRMAIRRFTQAAAAAIALGVLVVGTVLAIPSASSQPAVSSTASSEPEWRKPFDAVYTLDEGESIRRVLPPFIPSRLDFYRAYHHPRPASMPGPGAGPQTAWNAGVVGGPPPVAMQLEWDPQTRRIESIERRIYDAPWRFERNIVNLVGLRPDQISIPPNMLHRDLPGDWIYRKGSTPDRRLKSFQKILQNTPDAFRYEVKKLKRDVIVIRGTFVPADWPDQTISLTFDAKDKGKPVQAGDIIYFIRIMTMKLGRPLVNEWAGSDQASIVFPQNKDFKVRDLKGEAQDKRLREILQSMSQQMHVELLLETREIETYVFTPG